MTANEARRLSREAAAPSLQDALINRVIEAWEAVVREAALAGERSAKLTELDCLKAMMTIDILIGVLEHLQNCGFVTRQMCGGPTEFYFVVSW